MVRLRRVFIVDVRERTARGSRRVQSRRERTCRLNMASSLNWTMRRRVGGGWGDKEEEARKTKFLPRCPSRMEEVETEGSGVRGYPQLHIVSSRLA